MRKRLFDLVLAWAALILLSPLMLGLALWVRLSSPGPIFFRQERIGQHGVPFRIHKFRTMVHNPTDDGPLISTTDDPRVTACGRILRRTKLDELPQLIDVIEGTMSLVGPRPEVARYVAHYTEAQKARILSVRPGITDFASVAFSEEGDLLARADDPERTYVDVILPQKLALAQAYVDQMSLRTDLFVLAQTVGTLLSR